MTAVQIWNALKTQFALQTEEDLIRMKTEFYTIVKLPSETIDQYITKFENQLAALRSQLPMELQLREAEVIMAFNNSLSRSSIHPGEEGWRSLATWLGRNNGQTSRHQAYTDAHTFYQSFIVPFMRPAAETKAYVVSSHQPASQQTDSAKAAYTSTHGKGNSWRGKGRGNGTNRSSNNNQQGQNYKKKSSFNPDAFCTYCEVQGHTEPICRNKVRAEKEAAAAASPNQASTAQVANL